MPNCHIWHEWIPVISSFHLQDVVRINCLDHAGVRGNKRAGWLALRETVGGTIFMSKGDIVKTIWIKKRETEDEFHTFTTSSE